MGCDYWPIQHIPTSYCPSTPRTHHRQPPPVFSSQISSPSSAGYLSPALAASQQLCALEPAFAGAPALPLHDASPLLHSVRTTHGQPSGKIKLRMGKIERHEHHEVSIDGITPQQNHFSILISSLLLFSSPSRASTGDSTFNWTFMAWVMHYASALHLTTSRSRFNYVFSNIENGGRGVSLCPRYCVAWWLQVPTITTIKGKYVVNMPALLVNNHLMWTVIRWQCWQKSSANKVCKKCRLTRMLISKVGIFYVNQHIRYT